MNVKGHAAIVTGGGSGLGAETARHLAKAGAKVAVIDLQADAAKKVAGAFGGLGLGADVGDALSLEAAFAEARKAHGPARIAVCCAGIAPAARIVGKEGPMKLADFERVIRVNLIGTFNTMRLAAADMNALPPLDDNERGVIVMTASVAAFEGQIGQAAYAASKGGVVGLMLPAAREFARQGIRVLTIAPGLIGTPLLLNMPQPVQDSLAATVPFPSRFGHPHEYARLAMHMVENVLLNGEVVRLDGALRMQAK
ncbi:MAG: SDR family NAD(P)-dependent oxidoreductase [Alphaproteobacteria bacterium]|nr:SDR family NAD(P)-dependent oxidoreductase [Alphaproteobacteria bacterium]